MTRVILAVLAGLLVSGTAHAALQVFSCEPEWAALTQEIGGSHVEVFSATTAEQDVHYIQARPSLIARLRAADLLVCTGAGLEAGWLPVLQRRANNPAVLPGGPGYLELSQSVPLLDRPAVVDRAAGDVHPEGNPHFHLDPRNLLPIVERVAERLSTLDPAHAGDYQNARRAFAERWQRALSRWEAQAAPLRGRKVVVHHVDWNYLAHWLGLEIVATLEPKPGVPASSRHLSDLVQTLETQPATCILRTNYQDAKPSEWLASRAGIPALMLPYTVGADSNAQTLDEWFDELVNRLADQCR